MYTPAPTAACRRARLVDVSGPRPCAGRGRERGRGRGRGPVRGRGRGWHRRGRLGQRLGPRQGMCDGAGPDACFFSENFTVSFRDAAAFSFPGGSASEPAPPEPVGAPFRSPADRRTPEPLQRAPGGVGRRRRGTAAGSRYVRRGTTAGSQSPPPRRPVAPAARGTPHEARRLVLCATGTAAGSQRAESSA